MAKKVKESTKKTSVPAATNEETNKVAKKRGPGHINYGAENAKPGDNSRYLRYAMASWDLPPIDISDPKQVESRITEYFVHCIEKDRKPNMIGMANWLGVDRGTVRTWKNGEYRGTTHSTIIEKAVDVLEELWVDYMQNGKVNPACGIFIGKNMFGYRDVQDVVVAPKNAMGEIEDKDALLQKAAQLTEETIDVMALSEE